MKIVISGISGFVGSKLKEMFEANNNEIVGLTRSDIKNINSIKSKIENADVVINLAGAPIINRWTNSYKKELYLSRINTTKNIVEAINQLEKKPNIFISTSAVGIYDSENILNTEDNNKYADDFLSQLCEDWEKEALKVNNVRTVILRLGIVLGKDGGAFKKMITPFKLGLGGIIGDGKQSFPFIHIKDLMNIYKFIIEKNNIKGVVNAVSPDLIDNEKYTETLGKVLNKRTPFPVPECLLRFLFGDGCNVLIKGQKVYPNVLISEDFNYSFDKIENCLIDLTS